MGEEAFTSYHSSSVVDSNRKRGTLHSQQEEAYTLLSEQEEERFSPDLATA